MKLLKTKLLQQMNFFYKLLTNHLVKIYRKSFSKKKLFL